MFRLRDIRSSRHSVCQLSMPDGPGLHRHPWRQPLFRASVPENPVSQTEYQELLTSLRKSHQGRPSAWFQLATAYLHFNYDTKNMKRESLFYRGFSLHIVSRAVNESLDYGLFWRVHITEHK